MWIERFCMAYRFVKSALQKTAMCENFVKNNVFLMKEKLFLCYTKLVLLEKRDAV